MDPIEIIGALLAIPAVRSEIETLVLKLVAEILHRRSVDPDYLAKSDSAFALWASAKTDEEKLNAQKALVALSGS